MLKDHTILCLASGYEAPPTSKHHVMHLLAEHNTVLWVNYHASRAPSASTSDMMHIARKLRQVFHGMKNPRKNLHVLTPLVAPWPTKPWARALNRKLMIAQIRPALKRLQNGPLHIWSFCPDVSYLLGHFGEERAMYYCVDDFSSFQDYNQQQVLRDEEELCRRVNLVVTTSQTLQNAKAPLNPNTILVQHGVDYDHFAQALKPDLPEPADLAAIPHPRITFIGLIRSWVDIDLLAAVARRRPDWHFVIIGDSTENHDSCRDLPNMHFLGRKDYRDLPAYCRGMDAGVIPFRINELTLAANPIKLREYLAAGLPVVSTPLPEVANWQPWARLADGPEAFENALAAALAEPPSRRAERSAAVAHETWQAKVDDICLAMEGPSK